MITFPSSSFFLLSFPFVFITYVLIYILFFISVYLSLSTTVLTYILTFCEPLFSHSICLPFCISTFPSFFSHTECPNIWEARCTLPTVGTVCIHRLEFCDGFVKCGDDELDCSKYLFQFGLRLPSEDFSSLLLVPADGYYYYYKQVFLKLIVMLFL